MKIKNIFLFLLIAGCQSPTELPPEPKFVLNQHVEKLELHYVKGSERPTNLDDFDIKTKDRPIHGRTSRHIYFPTYENESLTQKRVIFLRDYLEERGYKSFQFKYERNPTTSDNQMNLRIRVYNVLLPRYNDGAWTQKMSIMSNELAMLEDIAVLFDDSPMPDIQAASSIQAVRNYDKPKGGGDNNSTGNAAVGLANAGTGIAQTALSSGMPK